MVVVVVVIVVVVVMMDSPLDCCCNHYFAYIPWHGRTIDYDDDDDCVNDVSFFPLEFENENENENEMLIDYDVSNVLLHAYSLLYHEYVRMILVWRRIVLWI